MQLPTAVQVTAFVPPPLGPAIDTARRRWDPMMGALIPAHITLVHRLADHLDADVVAQRLRGIPPIRVRITDMARWSGDEIGMYLAVDDIDGAIAALRESLEVVQPPGLDYLPHVTVLHPHTTAPSTVDRAWTELGEWRPQCEVIVDDVHVIDVDGSGWRTLATIALEGPRHGE